MRFNALPRHRNGTRKAKTGTFDTDAKNRKKWKNLENDAGSRMGRKNIRYALGCLAAIAFVALLRSDYALESTMDSGGNLDALTVTTTLPKFKAGPVNITNHLAASSTTPPVMNLTVTETNVSTVNSSLSVEMANQTAEKFQWDGGSKDNYLQKDPGFPHSFPVYRTLPDSDRNETLNPRATPRTRPSEHAKQMFEKREQEFHQIMNSTRELVPCRLDEADSCLRENNTVNVESSNTSGVGAVGSAIVLYNPLDEVRFWCGKPIYGRGVEVINEIPGECLAGKNTLSLPYVYSAGTPGIRNEDIPTGDGMENPVKLAFNAGDYFKGCPASFEPVNCPVPCEKCQRFWQNMNRIYIPNSNWTIQFTMEGERYYPDFHVEPTFYRKNIFYATTSFKSEIPITYSGLNTFDNIPPSVDFDKVIKGASFMARNCQSHNNRESVVEALMETDLRIDSISYCIHNAEVPPGINKENKTAVQEQYLFHLAFENQNADDYITEKLWGTLLSGTLPIYLGAPNIREHVPKNSIIVAEDFENPQALADYLVRLTKDKDLYQSYHKWRNEPQDWFRDKYEFTKTHSECRMCKFVYARQRGLGWDHSKQAIVEPRIEHKTCRNAKGLIRHPFQETWRSGTSDTKTLTPLSSKDESDSCSLNDENRVIQVDGGVIQRKVYDRDGVTDLFIDITTGGSEKSNYPDQYILRMETPIKKHLPKIISDKALWIQDDESRVYAMVSGDDGIELSTVDKIGTIEVRIPVKPSTTKTSIRIRIVSEDIDHFHQDAEKFMTNFGDMMMRDFFHPVESYWYSDQQN